MERENEIFTPFGQMQEQIIDPVKQARWDEVSHKVEDTTDRLGMPIDEGVKEGVIALNALGLVTTGSCEGHLERAVGGPWIDLMIEVPQEQLQTTREAFKVAGKAYDEQKPMEEIEALYKIAHSLRLEEERPTLALAKKAMELIAEFYKDRVVPHDRIIVIHPVARMARIESAGTFLQEIADPDFRAIKLKEYQEEMDAFSAFLKQKFFYSSATSEESN